MHVLIGLVTVILFLYVFVTFRPFRILVGVAVLGCVGLITAIALGNRESQQREQDAEAKRQIERRESDERQKMRWSRVSPLKVELRDPILSRKQMQFGDNEFALTASIKNNSDFLIAGFEIHVALSDCKSKSDCEKIGEATTMTWTNIPAHQARAISGEVKLYNLPKPRGKLSIAYNVNRVYVDDATGCHDTNPDAGMAWNALHTLECSAKSEQVQR